MTNVYFDLIYEGDIGKWADVESINPVFVGGIFETKQWNMVDCDKEGCKRVEYNTGIVGRILHDSLGDTSLYSPSMTFFLPPVTVHRKEHIVTIESDNIIEARVWPNVPTNPRVLFTEDRMYLGHVRLKDSVIGVKVGESGLRNMYASMSIGAAMLLEDILTEYRKSEIGKDEYPTYGLRLRPGWKKRPGYSHEDGSCCVNDAVLLFSRLMKPCTRDLSSEDGNYLADAFQYISESSPKALRYFYSFLNEWPASLDKKPNCMQLSDGDTELVLRTLERAIYKDLSDGEIGTKQNVCFDEFAKIMKERRKAMSKKKYLSGISRMADDLGWRRRGK